MRRLPASITSLLLLGLLVPALLLAAAQDPDDGPASSATDGDETADAADADPTAPGDDDERVTEDDKDDPDEIADVTYQPIRLQYQPGDVGGEYELSMVARGTVVLTTPDPAAPIERFASETRSAVTMRVEREDIMEESAQLAFSLLSLSGAFDDGDQSVEFSIDSDGTTMALDGAAGVIHEWLDYWGDGIDPFDGAPSSLKRKIAFATLDLRPQGVDGAAVPYAGVLRDQQTELPPVAPRGGAGRGDRPDARSLSWLVSPHRLASIIMLPLRSGEFEVGFITLPDGDVLFQAAPGEAATTWDVPVLFPHPLEPQRVLAATLRCTYRQREVLHFGGDDPIAKDHRIHIVDFEVLFADADVPEGADEFTVTGTFRFDETAHRMQQVSYQAVIGRDVPDLPAGYAGRYDVTANYTARFTNPVE